MNKEGREAPVRRKIAVESEDMTSALALYFRILHAALPKGVSFLDTPSSALNII